jgi:hypothetical protein
MADLTFLSWLRRGLATGLQTAAADEGATEIDLVVTSNVLVNNVAVTVPVALPVVGPGDIAGVDPRVVVKVTPGRDESDAEFDQFPSIELDQPDLPWRYSPIASPVSPAPDQILPWVALVVLEDGEIAGRVPAGPDQKLSLVNVTSAASLPSLADSWAHAHVQTSGAGDASSVATALGGAPGKVIARIFCPRKLKKATAYNAFLVPTFERGRRAGTGEPLAPSVPPATGDPPADIPALTPAWDASTTAGVTLPVYYEWRFQTGLVGSFEELVKRVKPAKLPDTVGRRRLDVSVPGYTLPTAVPPVQPPATRDTALLVEGALQSLPAAALPPVGVSADFVTALRNLLAAGQGSFPGIPGVKRVVVPPVYGQWPAAIAGLGTPPAPAPTNPPWVVELNTDPRNRVAAGLGTSVVQGSQDALMAGAWEQVGNLRSVNEERRITQAGRETFIRAFNRHVMSGRQESIFGLIGSLFGQLHAATGTQTVHAQVSAGPAGRDLLDPQWRRLSAPRGPLGRRLGFQTTPLTGLGAIERMNNKSFRPAPEPRTPAGLALSIDAFRSLVPGELTPGRITILFGKGSDLLLFWGILFFCVGRKLLIGPASPTWTWWWLLRMVRFGLELIRLAAGRASTDFRVALRDGTLTSGLVSALPKVPTFAATDDVPSPLVAIPPSGTTDSADSTRFRTGLTELLNDLAVARVAIPNPTPLDLTALRNLLAGRLHPGVTLSASMASRITLVGVTWLSTDPLEPFLIGPELFQAMWAPLRDRSQEWIVPGLAQVATDTLGLLVPNERFIQAYMVGLNHEMARELLWNEYPADQRATVFRQFWDTGGYVMTPAETTQNPATVQEGLRDIKQIHTWGNTHLGDDSNSARRRPPSNTLVLLLRAELIHRYPNVVVYALPVPGAFPEPPVNEIFPVFSGRLGLDAGYYGFELGVSDARGTAPPWYFVLQEQPGEPRFHVPDGTTVADGLFLRPADLGTTVGSAADFAFSTFRPPIRLAVPAISLVPET